MRAWKGVGYMKEWSDKANGAYRWTGEPPRLAVLGDRQHGELGRFYGSFFEGRHSHVHC